MRHGPAAILIGALLAPVSATAQYSPNNPFPLAVAKQSIEDYELFWLWNGCQPITIDVRVSLGESNLDITEVGVTTLVRSRLRAARLYIDRGHAPALRVGAGFTEKAQAINVEFVKYAVDPAADAGAWTVTWRDGVYGQHGGSVPRIRSEIGRMVDGFIDDYLRVNEAACK